MRTKHSQNEVIDVLRDYSAEFLAFYKDYENTLEELRIQWFENPSLVNGRCKPLLNGTFEIELKLIPPLNETAFVVAHELFHCILWHLGYPKLGTRDSRCQGVIADLNSMVYDRYINTKLRNYFEDGCQLIILRSQQYFDQNLRDRINISDESEIKTLFVYVNFRLWYEILCNTTEIQESEFFRWFDSYRRDFITESDELIGLIKSTNMDEPEKVRQLFKETIKRYTLEPLHIV